LWFWLFLSIFFMAKLINFYVKLLCIINQHYESVLLINNLYFILCTCMSLLHIYYLNICNNFYSYIKSKKWHDHSRVRTQEQFKSSHMSSSGRHWSLVKYFVRISKSNENWIQSYWLWTYIDYAGIHRRSKTCLCVLFKNTLRYL